MNGTASSAATICARLVLPRPGGPASRTWSSASPRPFAASMKISSCSLTRGCPTNSDSLRGRNDWSSSSSTVRTGDWIRCSAASRSSTPGVRMRPLTAGPPCECASCGRPCAQRALDQLLGGLAVGARKQLLRLLDREAEPDEAVTGHRPRIVGAPDDDAVALADLFAQLDDDPLGRALADPGHGLEALGVAGCDRVQQLAGRSPRQHGERHLWTYALHPEQQQEQVALVLGREAVELHRVVAHDQVRVKERLLADRRDLLQRVSRD